MHWRRGIRNFIYPFCPYRAGLKEESPQNFPAGVLSVSTAIMSLGCVYVILMQALQELQKEKRERLTAKSRNSVVSLTGDPGGEGTSAAAIESRAVSPTRTSKEVKSDMLVEDVHFTMQKLKREVAELKSTNSKLMLTNSQFEDDLAHVQAKFDEEKRAYLNGKKWFVPKIQKVNVTFILSIKSQVLGFDAFSCQVGGFDADDRQGVRGSKT